MTARKPRGPDRALLDLDMREGVRITVPKALSRATLNQAVKAVNEQALEWITDRAVDILDAGIRRHGRPQTYNRLRTPTDKATQSLHKTIQNPASHKATATDVLFMIHEKVRRLSPHYWVQDTGTDMFVDYQFATLRGAAPVGFVSRNGKMIGADAGRYPRDATKRGPYASRIKRPIAGYHYSSGAIASFQENDIYYGLLAPAMAELEKQVPGMSIVITRGDG